VGEEIPTVRSSCRGPLTDRPAGVDVDAQHRCDGMVERMRRDHMCDSERPPRVARGGSQPEVDGPLARAF
jgi:hypothetical protein